MIMYVVKTYSADAMDAVHTCVAPAGVPLLPAPYSCRCLRCVKALHHVWKVQCGRPLTLTSLQNICANWLTNVPVDRFPLKQPTTAVSRSQPL